MTDTKQCEWCRGEVAREPDTSNRAWTKTRYCSASCVSTASAFRTAYAPMPHEAVQSVIEEAQLATGLDAYLQSTAGRDHPGIRSMVRGSLRQIDGCRP